MTNLTIDDISTSYEYAEWCISHAYEQGITVCNGHTLTEVMESDDFLLQYLKHIDYQGEE